MARAHGRGGARGRGALRLVQSAAVRRRRGHALRHAATLDRVERDGLAHRRHRHRFGARRHLVLQQPRPPAESRRQRVGAGRGAAQAPLGPHSEPRRDGQGLRGARARDLRGGHERARRGPKGARACRGRPGRRDPQPGTRPAVRRRRGLSRAPGDRELPAAPGTALGDGGQGRRQPSGLQRLGADVPQRDPDLPGRALRRAVRLHDTRVLRSRGPGPTRRAGRRLLAFAATAAAVALLVPAAASADSFSLLSADVGVQVQPDGSIGVSERLEVAFAGDFHFGYRDIPLRAGESLVNPLVVERGVAYARGNDTELAPGMRGTFGVERRGNTVRIVWYFDAENQTRAFTISYTLRGVAVAYDDAVDVNLKVWGDQWGEPLDRLVAVETAPGKILRAWG